jgi:ubiquinone biosynthesis protein UbiJ
MEILQKALNRYLSLDPESAKRMERLQNKTVLIELTGLNEKFFLFFATDGVRLLRDDNLVPDTVIRGTPLRLLHLTLTPATRQQFFSDDVSITGNLEVGQQVIHLFDEMEIDWEDQLSKIIGDASAYRLGSMARKLKGWLDDSKESLLQDVNEFLHEEKKLVPTSEALQDFYRDIDVLRMDADRLDARIQQLEARLAERGHK